MGGGAQPYTGGKSRVAASVTSFVALPKPAPARRVFRPARRVSWGTRIFAFLVFLLAVGAVGAFLEIFIPQQVAAISRMEANELKLATSGASDVNLSVNRLWADLSASSMSLSDDQLARDLALAKQTESATSEALGHVQAAQTYMAQAEAMPFQFKTPGFVATDRQSLQHLEKGLRAASKLAHGASLQIPVALSMNANSRGLGDLNNNLNARDWSAGARTAATLSTAIKLQEGPAGNPETLLDPLWGKWVDAMLAVVLDAQQLCLASAQNQTQLAQQNAHTLAVARDELGASLAAARANTAAWQSKTIQPLLDLLAREIAAGS